MTVKMRTTSTMLTTTRTTTSSHRTFLLLRKSNRVSHLTLRRNTPNRSTHHHNVLFCPPQWRIVVNFQFAELIHPPLDILVRNSPLADRAIAYGDDDGNDDDIDDDEYDYKNYKDDDDVISSESEGTVIPGTAYYIKLYYHRCWSA
jgi:hypothetical protein